MTLTAQSIQFQRDAASGVTKDTERLGMTLDDPTGYLQVEECALRDRDVVISRLRSTGYRGRWRDDTYFTFVLQDLGRYDLHIAGQDYSMSHGTLLAFRPNERETRIRPGKTGIRAAITLQVPIARMTALLQGLETSPEAAFPTDGLALHGDRGKTLARLLPQLAEDIFRRTGPLPLRVEQAIKLLIDEILCEMIGQRVEVPASRKLFPAFHRVRQAEDLMQAHSDEPISMAKLAEGLGVSLRSLQLAFAEVYGGCSPRDILNRIRLEKARARLLASPQDGQVTTIAMDSGFFHLGRFSQAYARAYGEKPSETLARRRA